MGRKAFLETLLQGAVGLLRRHRGALEGAGGRARQAERKGAETQEKGVHGRTCPARLRGHIGPNTRC